MLCMAWGTARPEPAPPSPVAAKIAGSVAAQLEQRVGRRLALSDAAVDWLESQPWPGNVRELAHAIERAAVLTEKDVLEPGHFAQQSREAQAPSDSGAQGAGSGTLRQAVELSERQAITAALEAAGGNRRQAAKRLGISLRTLFYKMEKLGIN